MHTLIASVIIPEDATPEFIEWANDLIKALELKVPGLDLEELDLVPLLYKMTIELKNNSRTLETLYKSVADTTDKETVE